MHRQWCEQWKADTWLFRDILRPFYVPDHGCLGIVKGAWKQSCRFAQVSISLSQIADIYPLYPTTAKSHMRGIATRRGRPNWLLILHNSSQKFGWDRIKAYCIIITRILPYRASWNWIREIARLDRRFQPIRSKRCGNLRVYPCWIRGPRSYFTHIYHPSDHHSSVILEYASTLSPNLN